MALGTSGDDIVTRPRVAVCITVYERGGQRVVIDEQTRLLRDRYEFVLLTEQLRAEPPAWLPVIEMRPWRSRLNPIANPRLGPTLAEFDAIHCHDSFAYIWEASKTGKPLLVTSYGNCPGRYRGSLRLKFEYYISEPVYGIAYRRAHRVIAISEYIREWLAQRYGVEAALCYIGVDTQRFAPSHSVREPAFLYVGEQSERKGVPALIDAFLRWRPRHPEFRLWLAGFGPMSARISALQHRGVDFLGFLSEEELVDRYRRCRAFVTPSYWEGFGLPILEAFATETPVLARRGYAMTELAGNVNCAALFDGDKELSDGLEQMLSISQNGCRQARQFAEQFTWERSAARLDSIYASVVPALAASAR